MPSNIMCTQLYAETEKIPEVNSQRKPMYIIFSSNYQ